MAVLFWAVLSAVVLFSVVLFVAILFSVVLFVAMLFSVVLFAAILFSVMLSAVVLLSVLLSAAVFVAVSMTWRNGWQLGRWGRWEAQAQQHRAARHRRAVLGLLYGMLEDVYLGGELLYFGFVAGAFGLQGGHNALVVVVDVAFGEVVVFGAGVGLQAAHLFAVAPPVDYPSAVAQQGEKSQK